MELFSEVLSRDDFYEVLWVTDYVGNDEDTFWLCFEGGSVAFPMLEARGWQDFYCFFVCQCFLEFDAFLGIFRLSVPGYGMKPSFSIICFFTQGSFMYLAPSPFPERTVPLRQMVFKVFPAYCES